MSPSDQRHLMTHPAALWGIFGFVLILSQAILRLTPMAYEPLASDSLQAYHYVLFVVSIVFNGYFEGYRAFQLQVAPRVMARASYLAQHPRPLHVVLAPLFCMSLFHASRKRLIISWSVYAGIIMLVVLVRQVPQPWRGIVDAGVVVGLSWGVVAIIAAFVELRRGGSLQVPADLPEPS